MVGFVYRATEQQSEEDRKAEKSDARFLSALVAESQEFANRRRRATTMSRSGEPVEGKTGPARTFVAKSGKLRAFDAPIGPSAAEQLTGTCTRCGSRLAYGCEHHPKKETAE